MQPATLLDAYVIYEKAGLPVGPRDQWLEDFRDATLWPIARDGKYVGMILLHQVPTGQVLIHIGVLPEWKGRWITKSMLKAYPHWKPECPVYAMVERNNFSLHRLMRRLEFKFHADANDYLIYAKEPSCPPSQQQ
jgi:RimJ/RimL family protein N-acetyltransferase